MQAMHHACLPLLIILLGLSACGAPAITVPTPEQTSPARLPSVTPVLTPSAAPTFAPIDLATGPTAVLPTARPTSGVRQTDTGAVTPSMDRLGLSGEPYAALGDPYAPITVVEFADFGCEFCRIYHQRTFTRLRAEYIETGLVYYVYKDLPVVSRQGGPAAQAAECAGEQGDYWGMHDLLFREPERWNAGIDQALATFAEHAVQLQLDPDLLTTCVVEERFSPNIELNLQEAHNLRIFGTPAFFINGKLLSGAQPFEVWAEILDDAVDR
jgi:protein-disulfide isomerase